MWEIIYFQALPPPENFSADSPASSVLSVQPQFRYFFLDVCARFGSLFCKPPSSIIGNGFLFSYLYLNVFFIHIYYNITNFNTKVIISTVLFKIYPHLVLKLNGCVRVYICVCVSVIKFYFCFCLLFVEFYCYFIYNFRP